MSPSVSVRLLLTQSDARLVGLARTGHERAFEALVERYRRPLLAYCRRQLLPNDRAEDALQQGLLQAWLALREGAEVRDVKPWLYRIVHNTALNMRRSGYDYAQLSETLSGAGAPPEDLDRRIAVREALAGLAALPEMQREALLRTAVDGSSYQETAVILGLSEGAVRGLVHRARVALRTATTALTPSPLLSWMLGAGGADAPLAARLSEVGAGGGAGLVAGLLKLTATAATAGLIVGGIGISREAHDAGPRRAGASMYGAAGEDAVRSAASYERHTQPVRYAQPERAPDGGPAPLRTPGRLHGEAGRPRSRRRPDPTLASGRRGDQATQRDHSAPAPILPSASRPASSHPDVPRADLEVIRPAALATRSGEDRGKRQGSEGGTGDERARNSGEGGEGGSSPGRGGGDGGDQRGSSGESLDRQTQGSQGDSSPSAPAPGEESGDSGQGAAQQAQGSQGSSDRQEGGDTRQELPGDPHNGRRASAGAESTAPTASAGGAESRTGNSAASNKSGGSRGGEG